MPLKLPVLFLIYRRPAQTQKVWEQIKQYAPTKLYIANDTPLSGEESQCQQALDITQHIDWPCEVFRLQRTTHLGCAKAVSEAINWFFTHEEAGIILEDDTLPHPSFFTFCEQVLPKYQHHPDVMMISGNNKQGYIENGCSLDYIRLANIWGWATWRNAWQKFDYNMKNWDVVKADPYFQHACGDTFFHKRKQIDATRAGNIDSWGYRWEYSMLAHKGTCIVPYRNLIENIGFGLDAYHTKEPIPHLYNSVNQGITLPLIFPK